MMFHLAYWSRKSLCWQIMKCISCKPRIQEVVLLSLPFIHLNRYLTFVKLQPCSRFWHAGYINMGKTLSGLKWIRYKEKQICIKQKSSKPFTVYYTIVTRLYILFFQASQTFWSVMNPTLLRERWAYEWFSNLPKISELVSKSEP